MSIRPTVTALPGLWPRRAAPRTPAVHQAATVAWLHRAMESSSDGGVPASNDVLRSSWAPSYPETTGYLIPALLDYSATTGDLTARATALDLAGYLLTVQAASGGIRSWSAASPLFIFDTAQVLQGWLAVHAETGDECYLA